MSTAITIRVQNTAIAATLNDSAHGAALAAKLPLDVRMSRWGEEYYGTCGLSMDNAAGAKDLVDLGAIAYWPPGDALCFFFGPTPASRGKEPRAASAVTVLGSIDTAAMKQLSSFGGSIVAKIERA